MVTIQKSFLDLFVTKNQPSKNKVEKLNESKISIHPLQKNPERGVFLILCLILLNAEPQKQTEHINININLLCSQFFEKLFVFGLRFL